MKNELKKKAEIFLELHHSKELLILPNVWDVLGAKLLESEGYPAIASASAAISYVNGVKDGENLNFEDLLKLLSNICKSTQLPVSADIERGYAKDKEELSKNIHKLLECGIIGINIEDSKPGEKKLISLNEQCERIESIRKVSNNFGVHLVINARTDGFMLYKNEDFLKEAISRGNAYKEAGADCFYPILCDNDELVEVNKKVSLPINAFASANTLPVDELEELGIARLSIGPSLLRVAISKMKEVLGDLKNYGIYDSFNSPGLLSGYDIQKIIS